MRRLIIVIVMILLINGFSAVHSETTPPRQVKTQSTSLQQIPSLSQIKPKRPPKIKLKRNSKGEYSWEINGENVGDIINADKRLRKELGME